MEFVTEVKGARWGFPSQVSVDVAGTGKYLSCTAPGTGITVYHLGWSHLNASIAIDGKFSELYVRDAGCAVQSPKGCYNATLCDIQSLPHQNHLLEITLQDYFSEQSDFNLDYVAINETIGSPPSAAPTQSATPTPSPSSPYVTRARFVRSR